MGVPEKYLFCAAERDGELLFCVTGHLFTGVARAVPLVGQSVLAYHPRHLPFISGAEWIWLPYLDGPY